MIDTVSVHKPAIIELCRRLGVIRLGVFGSAAREVDFETGHSDIDLLVLFDNRDRVDYIDRYLDLAEELEALLGHPVDLVTELSVQSPQFRSAIERDLEPIYARASQEAAA